MDLTVEPTDIEVAERLIRPHVRRTPVLELDRAELGLAAGPLTLKLELLQHAGSFKARGAFHNLLARDVPPAGIVAASGGNHGAAVAYAASRLGIKARIFVPTVSSPAKVERIRAFGAELVIEGQLYADALAAAEAWAADSGAMPIHAYDHPATVAGQGTLALELEQQADRLDSLLVAVGGGGLVGGVAAWYGGRVRVIAVEPEAAPTLHAALAAGTPVSAPAGGIAADSLAPRQVGRLPFAIAERFVAGSVLVPDDAIRAAQRLLWERLRVVAEPGGACALAGLLAGAYRPEAGERVGVLVCGGNTPAVRFDD